MTKSTILGIVTIIILIGTSSFAYWKSNNLQNQAHAYINQVDLGLYGHRGLVPANTIDKEQLLTEQIASVDKRFENGKRLEALALYNELLEQDPNNTELLLRVGIIYLQEKEYSLAQENLAIVYDDKESAFALDAAWFLALLNAEYNNLDKTHQLLKEVVDGRGNYHLQATALLMC